MDRRKVVRVLLGAAACLLAVAPAATAASLRSSTDEPVVLTGSKLGPLDGIKPRRLVAFRSTGSGAWRQIPVQVDQRLEVDFGTMPSSNGSPGATGTVYGTTAVGTEALQYADANTFVGADPDPTLDDDDEVAMIASDAGPRAPAHAGAPHGVVAAGARRVAVSDPLSGRKDFVYLYESKGSLDPSAGRDYVHYDFRLTSGDYRSTYKRAAGPNPETSSVRTKAYRVGFSDRWMYDQLHLHRGGASGVDISDGVKFGFAPGNCGRSEATFDAGEGAFVANVDGPVRAIRSYLGANSGPYTERTHLFYPRSQQIVTDLRVHPITGLWLYHDLSAAAIGMTYRDSSTAGKATVDGVDDPGFDGTAPSDWRLWSGPQGALFAAERYTSSFTSALQSGASDWYLDDSTPAYEQCWGDSEALGQAGWLTTASIPSTDPHIGGTDFLHATTSEVMGGPKAGAAHARRWSDQIDSPLTTRVSPG